MLKMYSPPLANPTNSPLGAAGSIALLRTTTVVGMHENVGGDGGGGDGGGGDGGGSTGGGGDGGGGKGGGELGGAKQSDRTTI